MKNEPTGWGRADYIQLGILGVGIIYCIVTGGLWWLQREAVHTGQRAYLIFHHAILDKALAIGESPHVTIDLLNSGQTPAQNVRYNLALQILSSPPVTITHGALIPSGDIGANQTFKLNAESLPLKGGEFDDVTADPFAFGNNSFTVINRPKLYLYGIVQYDDVFGGHDQSEFCAVYFAKENGFPGCSAHNTVK